MSDVVGEENLLEQSIISCDFSEPSLCKYFTPYLIYLLKPHIICMMYMPCHKILTATEICLCYESHFFLSF